MSGQTDSGREHRVVLLADADVLIDYRDSEISILRLAGRHLGRLIVIRSVLDEVRGITASDCQRLGIEVMENETEDFLEAAGIETRASFHDCLCLVACRKEGWTCVTNDAVLRRLCEHHGVRTRRGLGLMVDLVRLGALTPSRAIEVARLIQESNPHHINDRVIARFHTALEEL